MCEEFDHDAWWKQCIRRFLPELVLKTIPELYNDADFTIAPKFLSQELQDTLQNSDEHKSSLYVDELVEIQLKTGEAEWVLLHIEVQGKGNRDISWRMMLYCCLIFAHYHKMPIALAILTHKRPKREIPGIYEFNQYGTQHRYVYNIFEVYAQNDKELLNGNNPFDPIIYVAKKFRDYNGSTREKEFKKFSYLKEVAVLLNNRGWSIQDRRDILMFVGQIIRLRDEELKLEFEKFNSNLRGENKMLEKSFIEEWIEESENKAFTKGRSEGRAEGRSETLDEVAALLKQKGISPEIISELR